MSKSIKRFIVELKVCAIETERTITDNQGTKHSSNATKDKGKTVSSVRLIADTRTTTETETPDTFRETIAANDITGKEIFAKSFDNPVRFFILNHFDSEEREVGYELNDSMYSFPLRWFTEGADLVESIKARNTAAGWDIQKAFKGKKEVSPDKPEATTNIAFASNFEGDRTLHRALMKPYTQWMQHEDEAYMFYRENSTDVKYLPEETLPDNWWSESKEKTLKAVVRRFASIQNDITADMVDILFHHWYKYHDRNVPLHASAKAKLTLQDICRYRKIEPKGDNLRIAYLALRDVRALSLQDNTFNDRLFDMAFKPIQPTLDIDWNVETPPDGGIICIYSPSYFIEKSIDHNFIAPYLKSLWELDPKYHAKEKRLARYLRGEWRLNTQKYFRNNAESVRYRTWKDILDDAGIDYEAASVKRNPTRFIEQMDNAIERLYDGEIIRECNRTIYHSDDQKVLENLPRKGALKTWLSLRVHIEPTADVRDALLETNRKRIANIAQKQALPDAKKKRAKGRKAPQKSKKQG